MIAGLGSNNLRAAPDEAAELLAQIPEGAAMTVLDGPVCAAGRSWWKVQSGSSEGWTAEGEGQAYWLEPVLD